MEVKHNSARKDLEPSVLKDTQPGSTVNTDEWGVYNHLAKSDRFHVTVWARDDDGDNIREVHVNTSEGFWTGSRNFLLPFRGVKKVYLQQYLAIHKWAHNTNKCTMDFFKNFIWCHTIRLMSQNFYLSLVAAYRCELSSIRKAPKGTQSY